MQPCSFTYDQLRYCWQFLRCSQMYCKCREYMQDGVQEFAFDEWAGSKTGFMEETNSKNAKTIEKKQKSI